MPLTVELLPGHADTLCITYLKVTNRGNTISNEQNTDSCLQHICFVHYFIITMMLTFFLKEKQFCFDLRNAMWAVPTIILVCVCACMCKGHDVCVGVYASECLHSWRSRAESLHLAVPGVSAVIPLKGRQALAPTPEIQRILLAEISPPLSSKGKPDPCKPAESI